MQKKQKYNPGKEIGKKWKSFHNHNLSHDIERIATWFEENELIINLKKGKSEVMLFGTSQKLSKLRDTLQISYRGSCINVTSHYKYLGVDIDSTLNLNSHFDRTYKKATGRLKLLVNLTRNLQRLSILQ